MRTMIQLKATGMSTNQIAEAMKLNPETIRRYKRDPKWNKLNNKDLGSGEHQITHQTYKANKPERDKCFNDLFYFATEVLGYTEITKETHGELCTILDNFDKTDKNLLILMPRGTFKTTIVVFSYMVRELLRDPKNINYALQLSSFSKGCDWMMDVQNNFEKEQVR
jgi:hypothetical protein